MEKKITQRSWNHRLCAAARAHDADGIAVALAAGANPKATLDGWPALMSAAYSGKPECIRLLLPVSDVLWTDKKGLTPLLGALEHLEGAPFGLAEIECVRLLLAAGSDLSASYWSGSFKMRTVDDVAADTCDERGVAVRELIATERACRAAQKEQEELRRELGANSESEKRKPGASGASKASSGEADAGARARRARRV